MVPDDDDLRAYRELSARRLEEAHRGRVMAGYVKPDARSEYGWEREYAARLAQDDRDKVAAEESEWAKQRAEQAEQRAEQERENRIWLAEMREREARIDAEYPPLEPLTPEQRAARDAAKQELADLARGEQERRVQGVRTFAEGLKARGGRGGPGVTADDWREQD